MEILQQIICGGLHLLKKSQQWNVCNRNISRTQRQRFSISSNISKNLLRDSWKREQKIRSVESHSTLSVLINHFYKVYACILLIYSIKINNTCSGGHFWIVFQLNVDSWTCYLAIQTVHDNNGQHIQRFFCLDKSILQYISLHF